ncbi:MAG: LLM class flavin-dependent oxidoreductase [Pseudonocardiaceae bacterium]
MTRSSVNATEPRPACFFTRWAVRSGLSCCPRSAWRLVASVDQLSGGRFEFGAGAGWNRQEMRHHGTKPRQRMKLLREPVEAAPDGSSTPMRPTGRAGRLPETRHQPICD